MSKNPASHLPTMEELTAFLAKNEGKVGKREIARAFKVKGDDRRELRSMLRNIKETEPELLSHRKSFLGGLLAPKLSAEITGEDSSGAFIARPVHQDEEHSYQIIIKGKADFIKPPLKVGDVVIVKLDKSSLSHPPYRGEIIKRVSFSANRIVGLFITKGKGLGGIVTPVDRRLKMRFFVSKEDALATENNSIVLAEVSSFRFQNKAKIIKVLGASDTSYAATIISAYEHNLPLVFTAKALEEAKALKLPPPTGREDLRPVPLVTIDGKDARDFDDAVWAEPDTNPQNHGGWHIIVAIADVAYFVTEGSALDDMAKERGNSVYFPDRAIHMLPDEIAGELASLAPHKDRPCLACHLWIDKGGHTLKHHFTRAIMNSAARLNYDEVERVINPAAATTNIAQNAPAPTDPKILALLGNLNGAFQSFLKYREERGCLAIEGHEKQISLDDKGQITSITERQELLSYQLIEEFMIAANVAAAQTLEKVNMPVMYRVHPKPTAEKMAILQDFLNSLNIKVTHFDDPTPKDFNELLKLAKGGNNEESINEMVLRCQSPARYSPENIGHFGLSLESYAHFTSPIRRYSDILVHRALIEGLKLGNDGLHQTSDFEDIAEHISYTEKRADEAERDAEGRYIALSLQSHTGEILMGKITGLNGAGLFITLTDSFGEGFCPMRNIPFEYFIFDQVSNTIIGQNTGHIYALGDSVKVRLEEANPITGGILLSLDTSPRSNSFNSDLSNEGKKSTRLKGGFRFKPHRR